MTLRIRHKPSKTWAIFFVTLTFLVGFEAENSVAATPEPSPITFVQPKLQLWQQIPANLSYSAENLKSANQSIAQTQTRLAKVFSGWRAQGVASVKRSFASSFTDKHLSFYPEYAKFAKSYTLIGLDAKGKQLTSMIWPDRGQYSESRYRLIILKADNCQITSSKKSNYCAFSTPAAKDWLRLAIIERVGFVESNSGGYLFTLDLANTLLAHEEYTVRDGLVFSETITKGNWPKGGLPLANKVDIFDYKIEFGPDKWHATYTMKYMAPQKIADALTKSIDSFGEIAITPKFTW